MGKTVEDILNKYNNQPSISSVESIKNKYGVYSEPDKFKPESYQKRLFGEIKVSKNRKETTDDYNNRVRSMYDNLMNDYVKQNSVGQSDDFETTKRNMISSERLKSIDQDYIEKNRDSENAAFNKKRAKEHQDALKFQTENPNLAKEYNKKRLKLGYEIDDTPTKKEVTEWLGKFDKNGNKVSFDKDGNELDRGLYEKLTSYNKGVKSEKIETEPQNQSDYQKAVKKIEDGRDGILGVLDKTINRVSNKAVKTLPFLGDAPDVTEAQLWEELKKNPKDKKIIQQLQMSHAGQRKAKNKLEKSMDITGTVFGSVAPYIATSGLSAAALNGTKAGTTLANINNPLLQKTATAIATGLPTNTLVSGAKVLENKEGKTKGELAKDFAKEVAINTALDGGFEVAAHGIKKVLPTIKNGLEKIKVPSITKGETLPIKAENNKLYQSLSPEDRVKYVQNLLKPKKDIGVSELPNKPLQNGIDYKVDLEDKHLPKKQNGDIDFDKIGWYQEKKDINPIETNTNSIYQMAEKLHPEDSTKLLDSMDKGKAGYTNYVERMLDDLENNVVNRLGIKSGSKLSAAVQDFSERTYAKDFFESKGTKLEDVTPQEIEEANLFELKKKFPNDWQKITEAEKWFRNYYDPVIDQMNTVRAQIYPNQPDKIIPKRSNYMPHRNDLEGFAQLKNIFDSPSNISPELEHASGFTKPNSKWQGFTQKRGLGEYKSDAVGNAVQYIQGAGHVLNIDPVIKVLRGIDNELTASTSTTANQNNLIRLIREHAGDLAGKTNETDRLIMNKAIGRKWLKAITFVNNRVKSNMILGNLSSTLGQIGNVPLGVAKAKQYSVPGLMDTVGQLKNVLVNNSNVDSPIAKSSFLKERYLDKQLRRFDEGLLKKSKNLAAWMMEVVDRSVTNFIWNSMYRKGLAEKVADPLKFADYEARNIVAGRGIGEVPLFQKSKTAQILMPFTLEVGNQWKVLRKMVGEKDATGLLTFMVASWGLNKAVEEVRGNGGVAYDPLDAILDGYNETEGNAGEKALGSARYLTGETIGNIPGGNTALKIIGAEDKNQFGKGVFGSRNPNRFGSGITALKVVDNPLFGVMPFGANQIMKTYKGVKSFAKEGEYTDKNELKFPVEKSVKNLPAFLFGPGATVEGKEYYGNSQRKLSENQTKAYENAKKSGKEVKYYKDLTHKREQETIIRKLKSLKKEDSVKNQQEIEKLTKKLNSLRK